MSEPERSKKNKSRKKKEGYKNALGSERSASRGVEHISANDHQQATIRARTKVQQELTTDWACLKCTYNNSKDDRMCVMCGFDLDEDVQPVHPLTKVDYGFQKVEGKRPRRRGARTHSPHDSVSSIRSDRSGRSGRTGKSGKSSKRQGDDHSSRSESKDGERRKREEGPHNGSVHSNRSSGSRTPPHTDVPHLESDLPPLETREDAKSLPLLGNEGNGPPPGNSFPRDQISQRPQPNPRGLLAPNHVCSTYKVYCCSYPSANACPDGHLCMKFHDQFEHRRDLNTCYYRPEACPRVYTDRWMDPGHCPEKDRCALSHTDMELYYHFLTYKTEPCAAYMATGRCGWETVCSYTHAESERRVPDPQTFHEYFKHRPPSDAGNYRDGPPSFESAPQDPGFPNVRQDGHQQQQQQELYIEGVNDRLNALDLNYQYSDEDHRSRQKKLHSKSIAELTKQLDQLQDDNGLLTKALREEHRSSYDQIMESLNRIDKEDDQHVQEELEGLRKKVDDEQSVADELHQRVQCPECFNRFKNCVLVDCGHMFCSECVGENTKECIICFAEVSAVQQLQLGVY